MVTQLKKGILEMCILYQIKDELLYGYEIMKSVRQVFPDVYEGSVYAIWRRLHANGLVDVIQRDHPAARRENTMLLRNPAGNICPG